MASKCLECALTIFPPLVKLFIIRAEQEAMGYPQGMFRGSASST